MVDKNIDKSLPNEQSDDEIENMKFALSRMTDEDIQNIFDQAFDSFNQKNLESSKGDEK